MLLCLPGVAHAANRLPELDPSSAGSAVMLLSGCVLIFRAGRNK